MGVVVVKQKIGGGVQQYRGGENRQDFAEAGGTTFNRGENRCRALLPAPKHQPDEKESAEDDEGMAGAHDGWHRLLPVQVAKYLGIGVSGDAHRQEEQIKRDVWNEAAHHGSDIARRHRPAREDGGAQKNMRLGIHLFGPRTFSDPRAALALLCGSPGHEDCANRPMSQSAGLPRMRASVGGCLSWRRHRRDRNCAQSRFPCA